MKTVPVIYFSVGLLLNFAGPLAFQVKSEMKELRRQTVPVGEVISRRRKLFLAEILFRSLVLILYPFAYLLWYVDLYRSRKETAARELRHVRVRKEVEKIMETKKWEIIENRSFIYFRDAHGEGIVKCHGCGFKEEIVGFSVNHDVSHPLVRGYQCQKCGKFHRIRFLGSRIMTPFLKCSCGGELSNVNPIFCPWCKTRDVSFACECLI